MIGISILSKYLLRGIIGRALCISSNIANLIKNRDENIMERQTQDWSYPAESRI